MRTKKSDMIIKGRLLDVMLTDKKKMNKIILNSGTNMVIQILTLQIQTQRMKTRFLATGSISEMISIFSSLGSYVTIF